MKKYINHLFMLLLATATMTSCAEEEGTEPGNDPNPGVVLYQYKPDASYNADNDVMLRIAANNRTVEAYYLVEPTPEKKARVASLGESGYMDHVIQNGTKVEGISGASNADVMLTGLIDSYAITVVAVNENVKTATETTFVGLKWEPLGTGSLSTTFFGGVTIPCEFYKSSPILGYKAIAPYEDGYDITFNIESTNVTMAKQTVYSSYGDYGILYMAGSGVLEGNAIIVDASFSVSAGTFNGTFQEVFTLPAAE